MICSKRPIGGSARQPAETQGDASLKRSGELEPAPVTAGLVQEIWHLQIRHDHLSVTLVRPRKHLRGTRAGRFAVEGCDERLFAQLILSEAGRPEVESAMPSPTARRFGSWQPIRAAHLDGALYSGVCAHLGSGPLTWQETEANLDVETARHRDSASSQVSAAEDARFELARGCPQHAFQACALGH
jgi:hypothetical protein